jgi:Fe-S cluster biogenesis protein NfuA
MTLPDALSTTPATPSVRQRVQIIINQLRPLIQSDGGDLELIEVTEQGVVRVRLHGACVGCPSSNVTLKMGIERNIREKVPEVTAVESVESSEF